MEVNSCLLVNELKSANFGDTQVETPNGTQVTPSFASEHRAQEVRLSEKRRRVSGGHFAHLHHKHHLLSLLFQLLPACVACRLAGSGTGHAGRQQLKKK